MSLDPIDDEYGANSSCEECDANAIGNEQFVDIVQAKAPRGVWAMVHVFGSKLFFMQP